MIVFESNAPQRIKCLSVRIIKQNSEKFIPRDHKHLSEVFGRYGQDLYHTFRNSFIPLEDGFVIDSPIEKPDTDLLEKNKTVIHQTFSFINFDQTEVIYFLEFERSFVCRPNALTETFHNKFYTSCDIFYFYRDVQGFPKKNLVANMKSIVNSKWSVVVHPIDDFSLEGCFGMLTPNQQAMIHRLICTFAFKSLSEHQEIYFRLYDEIFNVEAALPDLALPTLRDPILTGMLFYEKYFELPYMDYIRYLCDDTSNLWTDITNLTSEECSAIRDFLNLLKKNENFSMADGSLVEKFGKRIVKFTSRIREIKRPKRAK